MKKRTLTIGAAAVVAVAVVGGGTWWALANGDREVTTHGNCATASYEFETDEEDGDRLEVTFELLTASAGEEWNVSLSQDGTVLFDGVRTSDAEAEIDLDVQAAPRDGDTRFVAEFAPVGSDREPCRAELTH